MNGERKQPRIPDELTALCQSMTDSQLRRTIRAICGESKRAGSRARRLSMGESRALVALMAEEARRAKA